MRLKLSIIYVIEEIGRDKIWDCLTNCLAQKKDETISDSKRQDSFEENYTLLKEYASQIMKYEHASPADADKAIKVIPICEQFLSVADETDKRKAFNAMKKEAKAEDPKSSIPYHSVFKHIIRGDDSWERVVSSVKSMHDRFALWDRKINEFNLKYADIPCCEIQLSDEPVKRNKMLMIPDIKYASVGKTFNKGKLLKFVVVDVETTGLKASSERIIQLSAVKYVDWEAVEIWNTYIDPKREIPKEASDINGITDDMVKGKPTIKQVAKSFADFVDNWDVVGYNLPFDYRFLYAEGIDLTEKKRKYYDVYALAKKAYKDDLDEFTLIEVAKYNGIYFNAHNSLNDCFATAEVFEKVIDEITNA